MNVLEIGPNKGKRQHPSWKTLNVVKGKEIDYVRDITKTLTGLPKFDLVYMSHVLEHVPWWLAPKTLQNIREIIVPGGKIEIWVPDFEKVVEMYQNPDMSRDKFRYHNKRNDPMVWINGRVFAGYTRIPWIYNKLSVWHKSLWDRKHLEKVLVQVGFHDPFKLEKPRGYHHGWVNLGVGAIA